MKSLIFSDIRGFPSELIRFEITETSYAALEENIGRVLNKIKEKRSMDSSG